MEAEQIGKTLETEKNNDYKAIKTWRIYFFFFPSSGGPTKKQHKEYRVSRENWIRCNEKRKKREENGAAIIKKRRRRMSKQNNCNYNNNKKKVLEKN